MARFSPSELIPWQTCLPPPLPPCTRVFVPWVLRVVAHGRELRAATHSPAHERNPPGQNRPLQPAAQRDRADSGGPDRCRATQERHMRAENRYARNQPNRFRHNDRTAPTEPVAPCAGPLLAPRPICTPGPQPAAPGGSGPIAPTPHTRDDAPTPPGQSPPAPVHSTVPGQVPPGHAEHMEPTAHGTASRTTNTSTGGHRGPQAQGTAPHRATHTRTCQQRATARVRGKSAEECDGATREVGPLVPLPSRGRAREECSGGCN